MLYTSLVVVPSIRMFAGTWEALIWFDDETENDQTFTPATTPHCMDVEDYMWRIVNEDTFQESLLYQVQFTGRKWKSIHRLCWS